MNRHAWDAYANFDLYWSADSTALIPFNYRPSYGGTVLQAYSRQAGDRALVRAGRSLGKQP